MKRVLITGGNGFIGSRLGDHLTREGSSVSLLDLAFDWRAEDLNCRRIICDVLDRRGLEAAAKDADFIIHLAGISRVEDGEKDPQRCALVNVEGTRNVAMVATEARKPLIFVSSREVYGNAPRLPVKEGSPKQPISTYARSKLEAEQIVSKAGKDEGLRYTILRLSNVYGSARDRQERVIPTFVRQAMTGQAITVHGGNQSMDFTFVDDVVTVISLMAENVGEVSEKDYNVVTGHSVSVSDLARLVKGYTYSQSALAFQEERSYFAHEFVADPSKIKAFLKENGGPPLRPVEEGLGLYVRRILDSLALRFVAR